MIPFVKAHACGNDFLIVEAKSGPRENIGRSQCACVRATPALARMVWSTSEWTGERSGHIRLFQCRRVDRRDLRQRDEVRGSLDGT